MSGAQFRVIADLAAAYGDGTVRVTAVQNLVFRWVRRDELTALYRSLQAAGLAAGRGLDRRRHELPRRRVLQARGDAVARTRPGRRAAPARTPALIDMARELDIKISGCPNGCGQHHIAAIGFQGSLRKIDGRAVPQYFIQVGGGIDPERTTFGRLAAKVPARRAAGARSPGPAVRRREGGGETPRRSSAARGVARQDAARGSRGDHAATATRRLHRSGGDHGVSSGDDGRRVRDVTAKVTEVTRVTKVSRGFVLKSVPGHDQHYLWEPWNAGTLGTRTVELLDYPTGTMEPLLYRRRSVRVGARV